MTIQKNWIDVDLDGFGQLMASRPKVAVVHDLLQNVFDEDATSAIVHLESIDSNTARLVVEDDCPNGFSDLTDAFTLYQPSKKKGDPTKRGRFNEGEKFVLSQCDEATIATTTGTVSFHPDGTRTVTTPTRTVGSSFVGNIRWTEADVCEVLHDVQQVLVPRGFTVTVNGDVMEGREPVKVIMGVSLPTLRMSEQGQMKPTRRNTSVDIIEAREGETPHLYEMGLPVVEIDTPWHINVDQKVPLNRDRDNVTPAYRRALLSAVLEATHYDTLTRGELSDVWVTDAIPDASEEAVKNVMDVRHGKGWVIGTPADREADKNAIAHGKQVVNGGTYSKDVWTSIKENNAAVSSATDYSLKPTHGDGPPYAHATPTKLTKAIQAYAKKAAMFLEDEPHFEINMIDDPRWQDAGARHMSRRIDINWLVQRRAGWGTMTTEELGQAIDDLMIHECAHKIAHDHLTMRYVNACTLMGAKFRTSSMKWKMNPATGERA